MLASGLVEAIRARVPGARFEGIAGPRMLALGCQSLYPMERLSVMGLTEAVGRYLELVPVRRRLARRFAEDPPDAFIGVDAPDFNLSLELALRRAGVKTVHFVSPSVWAWRRYRLAKIARAVDMMLALFPFEPPLYEERSIPVRFVGHPLADEIAMRTSRDAARERLGLDRQALTVGASPRQSNERAAAPCGAAGAHRALGAPAAARRAVRGATGRPRDAWVLRAGTGRARSRRPMRPVPGGVARCDGGERRGPARVRDRVARSDAAQAPDGDHLSDHAPHVDGGAGDAARRSRGTAEPPRRQAAGAGAAAGRCDARAARPPVLDRLDHPDRQRAVMEEFDRIHRTLRNDAFSKASEAVLEVAAA